MADINLKLQMVQKEVNDWKRKHPGKELPGSLKRRWLQATYKYAQYLKERRN